MGDGLNIINATWLPGFSSEPYSYGIWLIYVGILLNIYTSTHYLKEAHSKYKEALNEKR